jgi:hypothetical protein
LGAEAGLGELADYLLNGSTDQGRGLVIPMATIRDAGSLEQHIKKLEATADPVSELVLFGDFWSDDELRFARDRNIPIYQCLFDGTAKFQDTALEPTTPVRFLCDRVVGPQITVAHHEFFHLLDLRCMGKEPSRTQPLISGLMNAPELSGSLQERFRQFYNKCATDNEFSRSVLAMGSVLTAQQNELVKERVAKNSRLETLSNGLTCAVVAASEFVNLSHEALHQHYPTAGVTCVLTIWLNGATPQLAHSFRSWDGKTDVKAMVLATGGGGSAEAAGTRLPLDLQFTY